MNKKITIIKLLNKIANNEEIPKKIKYDSKIYTYNDFHRDYVLYEDKDIIDSNTYFVADLVNFNNLNNIVETLEEDKPIIEKLKVKDNEVIGKLENGSNYHYTLSAPQRVIINKLNELIDYINKIEEDGRN